MSSRKLNGERCHPSRHWLVVSIICLALSLAIRSLPGAERAALADGPLVGELSRKEALLFEGNHTFAGEQILEAMAYHLDYHIAAHRLAPLAAYTARLERKILLGYQSAGFPEVTVQATADTNAHRIVVNVSEGPRFLCGDLLLSGVSSMTNAAIKQKISAKLGGSQPGSSQQTNLATAIWRRLAPAPFDEFSLTRLKELVEEALAELDYFQPKVSVQILPDPARHLADLKVDIADAGIKGTIEKITVTGLRTNTTEQVLDFLKLRPGMELHVNLVSTISSQLWHSARFFHQEVHVGPLPETAKFELVLDLEELREAPPLNQELVPEAKALLKFRDWLTDWRKRPEDLVYSVSATAAWMRVQGDFVLSPSGFALAARANLSNGPPSLQYAMVATPELIGLYSSWRQRKFVAFRTEGGLNVAAFFELAPDPQTREDQGFHFGVGWSAETSAEGQPMTLDLRLAPVALVREAARLNATIQEGVLRSQITNGLDDASFDFTIEAATGRLLQGLGKGKAGCVRIGSEEGAFARLLREIAAATADHSNDCVTNHVFSSWVSFMATDFIEAPFVGLLLESLLQDLTKADFSTNALATVQQVRSTAALARDMVGQESLARLLEPLNRLFPSESDEEAHQESFVVPRDIVLESAAPNTAIMADFVLAQSDGLVPLDSWLWVLLREAAFTLAGQGRYTEAELNTLLNSDDLGPAGSLVTAVLVGRFDPRLARAFAKRGLSRLTAPEFHKDYRTWLDTNSIVGELSANALGLFRDLREDQVIALTAALPSEDAAFVRSLARRIRDAKDQAAADAAWPAIAQHWDLALRRHLELGLNHFLPQVQFLTDPMDLFARGLDLIAPDAVLRDFDEAAQCFRKAAEQGHAGAQLHLGILYEVGQGVPEDFAEAMRCYRKAAEQKEPHAYCHIGALYQAGKGVPRNLDKAALWYGAGAEQDCAASQFGLGRICEEQSNLDEALKRYRRAAEGGHPLAQAHLGELLSDGFSTTPDYVEACQWLLLAAEKQNNRIIEIDLRRVKAKLTEEQLAQARQRADAVTERLAEKQKEEEKKWRSQKK